MAKLIYSVLASLDGYIADEDGNFDWAAPDEEVHTFVNDLERGVGTYLYGRRMYEVMVFWENTKALDDEPHVMKDYAEIWQGADKVVYSRTLETVSSARTRLVRDFDPAEVRRMKAQAGRDISVGGPDLAAQALPTPEAHAQALRAELDLFSRINPVGAQFSACTVGWSLSVAGAVAVIVGLIVATNNPTCHDDLAHGYDCSGERCSTLMLGLGLTRPDLIQLQ